MTLKKIKGQFRKYKINGPGPSPFTYLGIRNWAGIRLNFFDSERLMTKWG